MGWPKYLKKSYTRENLEKKVLKRVQLRHDREFLDTLFITGDGGDLSLKPDLTKEETTRLKRIVKEIKAGRGGVRVLPLVIIAVLVGASVIFALFFKDPLADRLMEKYLGELNGATVDVDGLHLSLVNLEISWEKIQVADPDNLTRNMAELGSTVLKLNSLALLEKKLVADSIVSRDAGWDRERQTPGVLIAAGGSDVEGGKGGAFSAEKLQTEQTALISNAVSDPETFVNDQWDTLKTPALSEELKEKYARELEDRKTSTASLKEESRSLITEGQDFLGRDFSRYKSNPQEIPALAAEADSYYKKADSEKEALQAELKAVQDLKRSLGENRKALEMARDEDLARVKSLITLPEGGVKGLINDMVQSYLASLLGDKYDRFKKIAAFAQKFHQEGKEKLAADESAPGRNGRVVSFNSREWPDYFLQEALISSRGDSFSWEGSLRELALDPEQWPGPASAAFLWKQGEGSLGGQGTWDRRSEGDPSGGSFAFAGLPVTSDSLSGLGISRVRGNGGGTSSFSVDRDGRWELDARVTVSDPELERNGDDLVSDVLYSLLSGEDWKMNLSASGRGNDVNFTLDWPLLDQVDDQIGSLLKEQADDYLASVQEELLNRYAGEMGFLDEYLGDLDVSEALLKGNLSSLDGMKNKMDGKIEEIKAGATDQAAKEAEKLLEQTGAADAVKDAAKSLPKLF